jgi:hypothetical protein
LKKGIVIYSEDSHDIFLISILEALISHEIEILTIHSKNKQSRISKYFNRSPYSPYSSKSTISSIPLSFLSSYPMSINKRINKLLIHFRRIHKIFLFTSSFLFLPVKLKSLKSEINWSFVCLENYSQLSDLYISRLTSLLNSSLKSRFLVVHNTDEEKVINLHYLNFYDKFLVISNKITQTLPSEMIYSARRIPFAIPSKETIRAREAFLRNNRGINPIFKLVVIGEVSSDRRDYISILNFAKTIVNPLSLTLLGRITDHSIIEHADDIGLKLITFDQYVDQDSYDSLMSTFDYILYKSSNNNKYNKTKASGLLYDSMRYGVPVISLEALEAEFNYAPNIYVCDKNTKIDLTMLNNKKIILDNKKIIMRMEKNKQELEREIILALFGD